MVGEVRATQIIPDKPQFRVRLTSQPVKGTSMAIRAVKRLCHFQKTVLEKAGSLALFLRTNDPEDCEAEELLGRVAVARENFWSHAKPIYDRIEVEVGFLPSAALASSVVQIAESLEEVLRLLWQDVTNAPSSRDQLEALFSLVDWLEEMPDSFGAHFEELIKPPQVGGKFSAERFRTVGTQSSASGTALLAC
ncbi:MAG: hypothetical protein QME79_14970 [Bacillota bacterium]|nr:hypothetical protein [Bacillota bacterium]